MNFEELGELVADIVDYIIENSKEDLNKEEVENEVKSIIYDWVWDGGLEISLRELIIDEYGVDII